MSAPAQTDVAIKIRSLLLQHGLSEEQQIVAAVRICRDYAREFARAQKVQTCAEARTSDARAVADRVVGAAWAKALRLGREADRRVLRDMITAAIVTSEPRPLKTEPDFVNTTCDLPDCQNDAHGRGR